MYLEVQTGSTAPVAAFSATPTTGGAPLAVQFTDQSSFAPTAWSWDFGDGNSSTEQHPSHVYTSTGTYDVTLTVSNALGSDDETKVGYVDVSSMPVVHVADVVVSRKTTGRWARGTAEVLVHDESEAPISGVTVSGYFSDPNPAVFSDVTNGSGVTSFDSDRTKSPPANWCFVITDVSSSGTVYDPVANVFTSRCEDGSGSGPSLASVSEKPRLGLLQNHPNPFNPATTISYSLDRSRNVRLEVVDHVGRRVALLRDGIQDAGVHVVRWDAASHASGLYLYRLTADDYTATGTMLLLK
jgi:PKD repeat protein